MCSLVPRPFPPSVFDRMKYGGGRPGRSGNVRCHQVYRHMEGGAQLL